MKYSSSSNNLKPHSPPNSNSFSKHSTNSKNQISSHTLLNSIRRILLIFLFWNSFSFRKVFFASCWPPFSQLYCSVAMKYATPRTNLRNCANELL